eukprot:9918301-Lingulodinium_polyedra.AAC.1
MAPVAASWAPLGPFSARGVVGARGLQRFLPSSRRGPGAPAEAMALPSFGLSCWPPLVVVTQI